MATLLSLSVNLVGVEVIEELTGCGRDLLGTDIFL